LVVFAHKNYVISLTTLKNYIFSMFGPYSAIMRPSSDKSGLKVWLLFKLLNWDKKQGLLVVIIHRNYVIRLLALENHIFSPFRPYSAIRPSSGQSCRKKFGIGQISLLRLETRLININYLYKLCNTTHISWKYFPHVYSLLTLIRPSSGQSVLKVWLLIKLLN